MEEQLQQPNTTTSNYMELKYLSVYYYDTILV
jgi:hypothetical protein